ncbi:MAG TPA: hypothetical protein VFZ47_01025, partial [Chitinophagaceae bacterium]
IQKTLSTYLEGIPATLTSKLLPMRSGLSLGVWLHVYLQGAVKSDNRNAVTQVGFNRKKLLNLITHLETIIGGFRSRKEGTTWGDYYDNTILSQQYLQEKEKLFREMIQGLEYRTALDAGTNEGHFAKILAEGNDQKNIVAVDNDAVAMNKLYRHIKTNGITNILPLQVDITQPSPALGYRNLERSAFFDRIRVDVVNALALIHHLVYGKNIPLSSLAGFFADITGKYLLIEFVPPGDPKVVTISKNRTAVHRYDSRTFEESFGALFNILKKKTIPGTERVLYLMEKRD